MITAVSVAILQHLENILAVQNIMKNLIKAKRTRVKLVV